ncbi:MAG: hypothetical protein ABFS14_11050, partial [Gemmatimonadota bacterium]
DSGVSVLAAAHDNACTRVHEAFLVALRVLHAPEPNNLLDTRPLEAEAAVSPALKLLGHHKRRRG